MKQITKLCLIILLFVFVEALTVGQVVDAKQPLSENGDFKIGWATIDITPDQPVFLAGLFKARVSEGIMDPVTATAMAIDSEKDEGVIMVSVDLVSIEDELREAVYSKLQGQLSEVSANHVLINATHTHAAPYASAINVKNKYGLSPDEFADDIMPPKEYIDFAANRIAKIVVDAWNSRQRSGISYGLGHAVVGHNRLAVYDDGSAQMYGNVDTPDFSHIEGYEDHSVNLLYTWDKESSLTGVVVNVANPSQVSSQSFRITADYWHDVREIIREKLGQNVYILAQTSSAGDQSPRIMIEKKAEERMQQIMLGGRDTGPGSIGRRQQIAFRITNAVAGVLPYMRNHIDWNPAFGLRSETLNLPRRMISEEDVQMALEQATPYEKKYNKLLAKLNKNPNIKKESRWYVDITNNYRRGVRGVTTKDRFELERKEPNIPVNIHVVRLGNVAFATNPFELYLDYGIRIKARSSAIQTFIVQLTGSKKQYLPPKRAISGGAYGSVPASTLVGPKGGEILVESTLKKIDDLWSEDH